MKLAAVWIVAFFWAGAALADREQWQCSDPNALFRYTQTQKHEDASQCPPDDHWKVEQYSIYSSHHTAIYMCGSGKKIVVGSTSQPFKLDKTQFSPFAVVQLSNGGSYAHGNLEFRLGTNPSPSSTPYYLICRVTAQP